MPAPLSIIIPTLNAADCIGPTLAALTPGLSGGLIHELILSDGGSDDDITKVADLAGARFLTGAKGRGQQLGAGALVARGEWLLFLHADTRLSENWDTAVLRHISGNRAGYFELRFDQPGLAARITAAWANFRSRAFGLPYGDQGLLISRQLYDQVGGYADIPLMEDVEISRKLRGQLIRIHATATTSANRYATNGWLWQGTRNLWRLLRYLTGTNPDKLNRRY